MPYIQQQFGGATVSYVEVIDGLRIGRGKDNDIVLDDATVSAQHAIVTCTPQGIQIRDLGSTNGIRINGKRVDFALLSQEDTVAIGTHNFNVVENVPDELQKTLRIKKSWIPGLYYTTE